MAVRVGHTSCVMQLISGSSHHAARLASFSSLLSSFTAVVLPNQEFPEPVCPVTLFSIPADALGFYSAERGWTVKWSWFRVCSGLNLSFCICSFPPVFKVSRAPSPHHSSWKVGPVSESLPPPPSMPTSSDSLSLSSSLYTNSSGLKLCSVLFPP